MKATCSEMEEPIVKLEKVSKTFRDFWLRPIVAAVDGLDLTVSRGEVFFSPDGHPIAATGVLLDVDRYRNVVFEPNDLHRIF